MPKEEKLLVCESTVCGPAHPRVFQKGESYELTAAEKKDYWYAFGLKQPSKRGTKPVETSVKPGSKTEKR